MSLSKPASASKGSKKTKVNQRELDDLMHPSIQAEQAKAKAAKASAWKNAVPVPGKLTGVAPGAALQFDLYDPSLTIEVLFGNTLSGASLLEAILSWYLDAELDVPWFTEGETGGPGTRNVIRSPLSRDLQECTVARYVERIKEEGLSQIVAGQIHESIFHEVKNVCHNLS